MSVGIKQRGLAEFELGLWRLFFEIRVVGLGILGVIALVPAAGVDPIIGVFILGFSVPANAAMRELITRWRFIPWWMPIIDATLSAVAILIQPSLAPIALLVMLGSTSQAATAGCRTTVIATLVGAPILFVTIVAKDVGDGVTQLLAYLAVSIGVTVFVAVISNAERDGRRSNEALLDLNQFKEVNDTLGHDQGDRLLAMVAVRLRESLRAVDTVARLGGDEFAVLLTDDVSPRRTLRAAERVLACFDGPHDMDGMSLQCGASLGVAIYPEHGDDAEDLRKHADIAMYTAKRRGGGVAVYDPERDRPNLERLTLVGQLRHGLDNAELQVHYQPVVDLSSARVVRVEALVRWNHPVRGLIGPAEFIDIAEVSGVIRPLTRWVFEQAANDVARLETAGHHLELAVNISVRNLYEPAFVDAIRGALERRGMTGDRIVLELTETQVMDDPLLAHGVLERLRNFGVRGSVEDFGTGHSSLSNLQSLPLSEIKIDKSFVQAIGDGDEAAATIVKSIVSLGQNLGLDVVAEGVETPSALTRLSMLGCDHAQGHLLATPLPYDDLVDFLDGARHGVSI